MRGRRRGATAAPAAPAALALVLLLGACGTGGTGGTGGADDADEPPGPAGSASPVPPPTGAPTPAPTPTPTPTPTPGQAPRERLVDVVALSAAGGTTETTLTPVAQPTEVTAYAARLEPSARGPLRAAIADAAVPLGLELQAAVVAVGCDEPADVLVSSDGAGWSVRAVRSRTTVQCLVPVTFVALVAVPS